MDGKSAIDLVGKVETQVMVPVRYESWKHFTKFASELTDVVKVEEFEDRAG